MSTKQLRINDRETIRRRMKEFVGRNITVVLNNQTAVFGELLAADDALVEMLNMRRKKMRYTLNTITEVYYDTLA